MYLLLLVFGALLTAAGIVLAATGAPFGDHALDAAIFTPGIVAVVGGLLLIGLGMALRVLQRIEQALALRQMPRVARPGEPADPIVAAELTSEPARIPLPSRSAIRPQTAVAAASAPLATVAETQADASPEKAAAMARLESARATEETEPARSLSPFAPSSVDLAVAEVDKARARRRNGAAPTRITPRFDLSPRPSNSAERPAGPALDALWPKGPRPLRTTAQAAPTTAPAVAAEPKSEPVFAPPAPVPAEAPVPVSVLKSGVVDGMAYTLYSDGSIEAQLPQGTLRFGSITELRNHIEQSA